jgi:uncharacterized protein YqeY
MISKIKAEQLNARKTKNKFKTSVLTALLSEIVAIGKNDGNRETTESEAINVIKKFKKNIQENIKLITDEEKIETLKNEIFIYDSFLPKQLSENEISIAIDKVLSSLDNPNMGMVIGKMKKEYGDQLDMGLTSKLVKEKLK